MEEENNRLLEAGNIDPTVPAPDTDTPKWYQDVSLEDAEIYIEANLKSAVRSVIAVGYYLKCVRDGELYRDAGYENIWDYARERFGFSKSTASRYMARNDRFSKDGNSPVLDERYSAFNKSQLQEMLGLGEEQLEQVTPDMTVQEIRAMKKHREIPYVEIPGQGSLEEYPGFYPEEMLGEEAEGPEETGEPAEAARPLASTEVHAVTAEDLIGAEVQSPGVAISQQPEEPPMDSIDERYRRDTYCEALALSMLRTWWDWFLADFKNRVYDVAEAEQSIKAKIKESPQNHAWSFEGPDGQEVNALLFSEEIEFWQGEKRLLLCGWFYLCAAIKDNWNNMATAKWHEKKAEEKLKEGDGQAEEPGWEESCKSDEGSEAFDINFIQEILDKERDRLEEFMRYKEKGAVPEKLMRKQKIIVAALDTMTHSLNQSESEKEAPIQPELPPLKNNDQRKDWLNAYHDWPVWFEVPEAAEVYYRYDLSDGSSLVICEYHYWLEWMIHYGNDPERIGTREYLLTPGYHYLEDCKSNRTAMIDKLKEIQKR